MAFSAIYFLLLSANPSLAEQTNEIPLNIELFEKSNLRPLLCFDLADDGIIPLIGILIDVNASASPQWEWIEIPFRALDIQRDSSLLLCWGSYHDTSIVHYINSSDASGVRAISIRPIMNQLPDVPVSQQDLENGLYFQRLGLERRFLLINNPTKRKSKTKPVLPVPSIEIGGYGVALPDKSEGREIRNSLTSIPQPNEIAGKVKFFSAASVATEKNTLELRYRVQPTSKQKIIVVYGLKLIILIIVPFFTLLLLPQKDTAHPKVRSVGIWSGIIIQVILIPLVVYVAWKVGAEVNWIDFSGSISGAFLQVFIIYVKSKKD